MDNLAVTTQRLVDEIDTHLKNIKQFELLEGPDAYDVELVRKRYNIVLTYNSNLNDLIIKSEHFQSIMKVTIKKLSDNIVAERNTKAQIKEAVSIVEEISKPLYTEKEKLDRLLRYFERAFNIYIRP